MSISDDLKTRLDELIAEGNVLATEAEREYAGSDWINLHSLEGKCAGWITAALNIVETICSGGNQTYRKRSNEIATAFNGNENHRYQQTYQMASVLERLKEDLDRGLITSVENEVTAVNYDDFLSHAEDYCRNKQKNESAVISGIVFEDTVRRICRLNDIDDDDVKLDVLISILVKKEILNGLKAKRARAAAGLRTSAAHAKWDDFDISDVKPVIDLTRELLDIHLTGH